MTALFARLLPNGALDANLGWPRRTVPARFSCQSTSKHIDSHGATTRWANSSQLACASDAGGDFCTARLNTDGSLDTALMSGRWQTVRASSALSLVAESTWPMPEVRFAIQTDGSDAGWSCHMTAADHVVCGARPNVDGSFDNTFFAPAGTSNGRFTLSRQPGRPRRRRPHPARRQKSYCLARALPVPYSASVQSDSEPRIGHFLRWACGQR